MLEEIIIPQIVFHMYNQNHSINFGYLILELTKLDLNIMTFLIIVNEIRHDLIIQKHKKVFESFLGIVGIFLIDF